MTLLGCEGVDGDSPAAQGEREWIAADSGFRVRYVSPPWSIARKEATLIELEIPPELFGVALDGSPPTHVFRMEYVDTPEGLDGLIDAVDTQGFETDGEIDPDAIDPDGLDTDGLDSDVVDMLDDEVIDEIPSYLLDVDLRAPRDVALAELTHLVEAEGAQIDQPLTAFRTHRGEGVSYQVVLDPGVFVRGFYFASDKNAVRAVFASLFDLQASDVEIMARTITTGAMQ